MTLMDESSPTHSSPASMFQKLQSSAMSRTLGKVGLYSAAKKLQYTGNFSVDKIQWYL